MNKILFAIPILLLFIPIQSFAQTPEAYHETVSKHCEAEMLPILHASCSMIFEHVPGKPFTVDLKINNDAPVWVTISSCSDFSKPNDCEGHGGQIVVTDNFVRTFNTNFEEVRVWLSNENYASGINFELNYEGYKHSPTILKNDSGFPLSALIILLILIGVVVFVLLVIRTRKQNTKMQNHQDELIIRKLKNKSIKKPEEITEGEPKGEEFSAIMQEQNIDSLKIIKERLAKGEITKKEYDELKKEFES